MQRVRSEKSVPQNLDGHRVLTHQPALLEADVVALVGGVARRRGLPSGPGVAPRHFDAELGGLALLAHAGLDARPLRGLARARGRARVEHGAPAPAAAPRRGRRPQPRAGGLVRPQRRPALRRGNEARASAHRRESFAVRQPAEQGAPPPPSRSRVVVSVLRPRRAAACP